MAGGVAELVQRRAVPIDRLEIGLWRRDLHIIVRRHVEGQVTADPKVDSCCLDQRLDLGLDQAGWRRWRDGRDFRRQTFALRGVEDREAL